MPGSDVASELTVLREPLREADGAQMLAGLRTALAWLEANQQEINDLNVYPVPDGDTGSNMYLTLRSAVEEAQRAKQPDSVEAVMAAAAHGSLMGARGNSGVILSQIFRGFAQGVSGSSRIDVRGIARALNEASAVAYRAVMKPTEGTILTVVREAAESAGAAAGETDDMRVVLNRVVRDAHAAVERTTDQLAVLREAGVVDAGGFGLAVIIEGFSQAVNESRPMLHEPAATPRRVSEPSVRIPGVAVEPAGTPTGRRGAAAIAEREEGWGYCTEFLISGENLDVDSIRHDLAALGGSALVVGDPELIRVHIHTTDPASLIGAASQKGRLSKLKVEDMSAQHHEVLERAGAAEAAAAQGGSQVPEAPPKPLGVVTVAPGAGFQEIFRSLGADAVVAGGQTMNPSIEDLLNGVRAAHAESVIVLPNNKNVILTAQKVNDVAECEVVVVPTRNLPQGISALLAFDPGADAASNSERMQGAAKTVRAVEITHAVRDSRANGKQIKEGDVIALVDGKITRVGGDYTDVVQGVLEDESREPELVTVYRGGDAGEADAEALVASLRERHPTTEFELHNGGQEHYPYVLSIE
ncbi:MAG: DAK2 domain-containing protein [Candidatus Dormibacteraeota bacterium]|nr:DAK2 domain-containing protein [Candidatus Dormibacteraeota bacterium]